MSHDFEDMYRNWHSCDPFVLFEAPVIAKVSQTPKPSRITLVLKRGAPTCS